MMPRRPETRAAYLTSPISAVMMVALVVVSGGPLPARAADDTAPAGQVEIITSPALSGKPAAQPKVGNKAPATGRPVTNEPATNGYVDVIESPYARHAAPPQPTPAQSTAAPAPSPAPTQLAPPPEPASAAPAPPPTPELAPPEQTPPKEAAGQPDQPAAGRDLQSLSNELDSWAAPEARRSRHAGAPRAQAAHRHRSKLTPVIPTSTQPAPEDDDIGSGVSQLKPEAQPSNPPPGTGADAAKNQNVSPPQPATPLMDAAKAQTAPVKAPPADAARNQVAAEPPTQPQPQPQGQSQTSPTVQAAEPPTQQPPPQGQSQTSPTVQADRPATPPVPPPSADDTILKRAPSATATSSRRPTAAPVTAPNDSHASAPTLPPVPEPPQPSARIAETPSQPPVQDKPRAAADVAPQSTPQPTPPLAQDEPPAPAQTAAGTASRPEPSPRPPLPDREPPGILAQVFGGLPGWLSRMPADVGLIAVLGLGVMFGLVFVGFRRSRETYD